MSKWFHELSKEKQLEIEEELVALVTSKDAYIQSYSLRGVAWLDVRGGGLLTRALRMENNDDNIRYYDKLSICHRFKTLPERVVLLLGIIHRPVFEIYKQYLIKNHL